MDMPVAIDTSVLIHAEKAGDFEHLLPDNLRAGLKNQNEAMFMRVGGA